MGVGRLSISLILIEELIMGFLVPTAAGLCLWLAVGRAYTPLVEVHRAPSSHNSPSVVGVPTSLKTISGAPAAGVGCDRVKRRSVFLGAVVAILGASPYMALAAKDCFSDCFSNCNRVASGSGGYCKDR